MQKRTRIFTVVTLLTGLLLALGTLLAIFGPAVMDVGAKNAGHRHNHGGKKTTVIVKNGTTVTTTLTTTFTALPPPPPPKFCEWAPNPVVLQTGNIAPGTGNTAAPGSSQFELICHNLNASGKYVVRFTFPCQLVTVHNNFFLPAGASFAGGVGQTIPVSPDLFGRLDLTVIVTGCEPGTGTITVSGVGPADLATVIVVQVPLVPPQPAKHK